MLDNCELDIATGEVIQEVTDVDLPLLVPIRLTRRYVSSCKECGIFGWGWVHNFNQVLSLGESGVVKLSPLDGDEVYSYEKCDGEQGPKVNIAIYDSQEGIRLYPLETKEAKHGLRSNELVLAYPKGSRETYSPDPENAKQWLLLKSEDADGNILRYRYDGKRLVNIQSSEGIIVNFEYNAIGLLVRIATFASQSSIEPLLEVHYEYNVNRDLVAYTDNTRQIWRYSYDDHLLVRLVDSNQYGRNYIYDPRRRCIGTWGDDGDHMRFLQCDDLRHNLLIFDSYGIRSLFRFNKNDALVSLVDAKGQITERILDGNDNVLATMDADGSISGFYRFEAGTGVLTTDDGADGVWRTEVNQHGQMFRITSPLGRVRIHEYDRQGRLVKATVPNGGVLQYTYDEHGNVNSLTDPLGYKIKRIVSSDGLVVRFVDGYGMLSEQKFDHLLNLLTDIDAEGRETTYTYQAMDFPASETNLIGAVNRYIYDRVMNVADYTDALGRLYRTEYDGVGNITAEIDPLGGRVEYVHDREDNLLSVINEKKEVLEVVYDELYQEIATKYFDGKTVQYDLDPLGRRIAITDGNGQRTELFYQGDSYIQKRVFFDGTVEEYDLNPDGEFIGISSTPPLGSSEESRQAEFTYDANGNPLSVIHNDRKIEYEWDPCNHLVAIRDSLGDETLFIRGARYRVDKIIALGREYQLHYRPSGELSEIIYPNRLRQVFDRDPIGRIIERRMLSAEGKVLTWRRFSYDLCDQLTEMEDWHWGSFRYRYDMRGRLIVVSSPDGHVLEEYAYDITDNLLECPLAPRIGIGKGNRLLSAGSQYFQYDNNGNLISRRDGAREWRYEWDRDDQLARVLCDGVTVGEYEYDLINRRVRKSTAGLNIEFLYERYTLRAEILDGGSHHHYVSLPGLPVYIAQRHSNGETYYYSYDHIGTPIEVFNELGELMLAVHTQAYGGARQEFRPRGGNLDLPFNFMGQYCDNESSLFYNQFRYYDPLLARYISQDPLGIYTGMNLYIYPTNPNNWIDPLGLQPKFTCQPQWGACQQWYARQKIAKMNKAAETRGIKRCSTSCRGDRQADDFRSKRCGGNTYSGATHAIDHMHDLQASGFDRCCENLRAIDKDFNNQLNVQVQDMFNSHVPKIVVGDVIGKISMTGCLTKGKCSKAGQKRVAKVPRNVKEKCPPKHEKPLC